MQSDAKGTLRLITLSRFKKRPVDNCYELSKDDERIIGEMYDNGSIFTGNPYTSLCAYNPELFVVIDRDGVRIRMEFCLDCGQAKVYEGSSLLMDTDFDLCREFIFGLVKKYHSGFDEKSYG